MRVLLKRRHFALFVIPSIPEYEQSEQEAESVAEVEDEVDQREEKTTGDGRRGTEDGVDGGGQVGEKIEKKDDGR